MEKNLATNRATEILLRKFKEGQLKNPRWSQRAFAQKLGVSSGALSEILKGKRSLNARQKKKMAAALQLSPKEQMEFFDEEIPGHLKPGQRDYFRLSVDQFHLISDWWHYGILNLIKTKGFQSNVPWMARRLGLPTKVVGDAWDRLFRLGHLAKRNGKVEREFPQIETTDEFFDLSIQKSHVEDTKLIEQSILKGSLGNRDHRSVTFVLSEKKMKRAKELIRLFEDQLLEEVEATSQSPGEDVYRLSISLFPLTQVKENS